MDIFQIIESDYFIEIIFFSWIFFTIHDFICCIINAINERTWIVKDYEEIIHDYITVDEAISFKDKKLIANAKENTQKRYARRQKLKNLFSKKRK